MHENLDLILTLTGAFTAALVFGYATYRLGLSPIVGYLLAGVAVGPNTPGFVADAKLANELAEVGVILLMFGVGLHFHLHDLLSVRRIAVPGALGQILLTTLVAGAVDVAFGGSLSAGLVFGLAISVASTVVMLRVLADNRELHTPIGHIAVGWLVVEDLVTVLVLVMLPVIFGSEGQGPTRILLSLGGSLLKIGLLVAAMMYVGRRLIPWLLTQMAATRSRIARAAPAISSVLSPRIARATTNADTCAPVQRPSIISPKARCDCPRERRPPSIISRNNWANAKSASGISFSFEECCYYNPISKI